MREICLVSYSIFSEIIVSMAEYLITDAVTLILHKGIMDGHLHPIPEGQRNKSQGFYEFNYVLPSEIENMVGGFKCFIECLRSSIKVNNLSGPNRRPLVLICSNPLKRSETQFDYKNIVYTEHSSFRSNNHFDKAF